MFLADRQMGVAELIKTTGISNKYVGVEKRIVCKLSITKQHWE